MYSSYIEGTLITTDITRMTIFIKTKFKKSYDKTNIDTYKVAANIREYHTISKLIFHTIIIPKFMKIRQLFHEKTACKNGKIQHV